MDESADTFKVDPAGNCNFCNDFFARTGTNSAAYNETARFELLEHIKFSGSGKQYDCIVGVSGGADSSWALHLAKKNGLRPLAVHMDNGWNSELAQNNINNLVDQLDVDFYSHVINWPEYRSLMQSFFDADVIDIELLYDNAMLAVNYNLAKKYGIKYILSGSNSATEGMTMPGNWNWFKYDKKNILSIDKKHSNTKINSFPFYDTKNYIIDRYMRNIKWTPFLDYFDYNKDKCMDTLTNQYGFKQYPYKHYESIFTRFYQAYILPQKFGVDKRKLHLSTLIVNQQMSRDTALTLLTNSPYPSTKEFESDRNYFLKKMGWSNDDLDQYLDRPPRNHLEYHSEKHMLKHVAKIATTVFPKKIQDIIRERAR